MEVGGTQVTNEECAPGHPPKWLKEHLVRQNVDPRSLAEGGVSRLMVIHPTEEARREMLAELDADGCAMDRNLHQTIASLASALATDFRMPRILTVDSAFEAILHEACRRKAARLGFPLINPLEEMNWGIGKTRALQELHTFLAKESAAIGWDGPGIKTFRRVLLELEKKLSGTHPDFMIERIIQKMEENNTPFSLLDIDGIIMLNHSPSTSRSHRNLMLAVSRHRGVHQVAYSGGYRTGEHGILLEDKWPITSADELAKWIPRHEITNEGELAEITRYLIQREIQSFEIALKLASEKMRADSSARVLIIDPNLAENRSRWSRGFADLGLPYREESVPLISQSLGHWINAYLNLAHGPDAFSLDNLRAFALQETMPLFGKVAKHPSNPNITPLADAELLSDIARSDHILGGAGALSRWIETLSREPINERQEIVKESTQWWLLSVANWIRPLLSGADRAFLDKVGKKGCQSGLDLPLPKSAEIADDWLAETLSLIDLSDAFEQNMIGLESSARIIQVIQKDFRNLRETQRILGYKPARMGPEWVDEISNLLSRSELKSTHSPVRTRLRLMTPSDSLGCTADLVIMANISSISWNLKVSKLPFMGDEKRHEKDLLRPDGPICAARHQRHHLFSCAKQVILLDPRADESTPPAAPIREWTLKHDPSGEGAVKLEIESNDSLSPRPHQQIAGKKLRQNIEPETPPLNPAAPALVQTAQLQRDRERRQPFVADDDGYLPDSAKNLLFQFRRDDLWKKNPRNREEEAAPRFNERWPVVTGRVKDGASDKMGITIDPRPFTPLATDLPVIDERTGHDVGAEQKVNIWSASRLHDWLRCPRAGWLGKSLRASIDEALKEDLDARTHGDLFHTVHHDLLCEVLEFEMGIDREINFNSNDPPLNLDRCGKSESELMRIALEALDERAPWLNRRDAVSTNRVRIMTGMNLDEWNDWTADRKPIPLAGRIGRMIRSELALIGCAPLAIEWDLSEFDEDGIEITLPKEYNPRGDELPSIRLRGLIDRVDIVPFDEDGTKWVDESGSDSIAPLKLEGSDWRPRRLILIRDLKTSESKDLRKRHYKGLLEELQLALYARSWELAHPGDLVVGVGISTLSHETAHFVEVSSRYQRQKNESKKPTVEKFQEGLKFGNRTDITLNKFRFSDEEKSPKSDPLRAWLAARIAVALSVAQGASLGKVHPTPSEDACKFCNVSEICDVTLKGADAWS